MNQLLKNFLTTFLVIVSFSFVFFCFSFTSFAEGNNYPYVISFENANYNTFALNNPDVISFGLSDPDIANAISGNDYLLYFDNDPSWAGFVYFNVIVNPVVLNPINYASSYTSQGFYVRGTHYQILITYRDGGYHIDGRYATTESEDVLLFGNTSLMTFSGFDGFTDGVYKQRYPYFSTINLYNGSNSDEVLLSVGGGSSDVISGSVVAPLFTGLTGGDIASNIPSLPSKPNISSYNPPTFNTSSITDSLNSIYDIIDYNLTYTINIVVDYFDYISSVIQYGFKAIIDNIQNGIQNIFDNFNSLFSPILNGIAEKISYIAEPVDSQSITQGIGNYEIFTDINAFKLIHDDFEDMVTNTSEPESFLIPVHIEKISYFSDVPTQYIDLQVLHDLPVLKPFCWVVVSVGLILIVASGLPQMLYGGDSNGK